MLDIVLSNRFKKDLKVISKRGYDLDLLDKVVENLASNIPLEEKYRDHSLTGNYVGFRECHILPDWLLIYRIDESEVVLILSRTGTHSDLF
ncbi:MAG: type II toxin-antitoxin system YafQ family toxin [Ruminococcaceae bacterium]|nr:type II toxin-antitoxin system YafQ family toxin [Oscillospiraceae bacterium]